MRRGAHWYRRRRAVPTTNAGSARSMRTCRLSSVCHLYGDKGLLNEPVFTELAEKYGKNNVQIILRWHIQEGTIVFPKSTNPKHIKDNIDIFDFELTAGEMERIRALDKGVRFFNMSLAEQEAHLSAFKPAD